MKNAIVINWKTTVIGLITAALVAWQQSPQGLTPKGAAILVAIAVFGAVCKDADALHLGTIDKLIMSHVEAEVNTQLNTAYKEAQSGK